MSERIETFRVIANDGSMVVLRCVSRACQQDRVSRDVHLYTLGSEHQIAVRFETDPSAWESRRCRCGVYH
jgi:hypothetical protein